MINDNIEKICSGCGELKDISCFSKLHNSKDGLQYTCKLCRKKYRENNKDDINYKQRESYYSNKEKILKSQKCYYESHKAIINRKSKIYRENNKCHIKLINKLYRDRNKEVLSDKNKAYRKANLDKVRFNDKLKYIKNKEKVILYGNSSAKYNLYFDKLTVDESPRLCNNGVHLEVRCKYCGKYFVPTINKVKNRIGSLIGNQDYLGDRFLYCSDGCKDSCPIFRQAKFPRGYKKSTSREVDSLIRQMCFERDDWECQICGKPVEEVSLHCHHIEGYTQNPSLGSDIDNVITLCKECHKEVHKLPGCNYHELRCLK